MTPYIDTYVASQTLAALQNFLSDYPTHIPIQKGRAAQEASVAPETGEIVESQNAVGDPDLFYSCIRTPANISVILNSPLSVVDVQTGKAVLGVFLGE